MTYTIKPWTRVACAECGDLFLAARAIEQDYASEDDVFCPECSVAVSIMKEAAEREHVLEERVRVLENKLRLMRVRARRRHRVCSC